MDASLILNILGFAMSALALGVMVYVAILLRRPPHRDADDHGA